MMWLKQSTAIDVSMGPFLDDTDGKTAETGLTITQPDIRLKKNGGAWAQKNAAQTLSHEEAGWYEVALDATDTNTLGSLLIAIHESGALPVWREFMVVPAVVYDAMIAGSDNLDVNTTQVGGTVQTAGDLKASLNTIDDFIDTEIAAIQTTLGTPAGASISADIAAIEAQTDDIGVAGAGLTAVPWNPAWDAEVQSEAADALAVYDPPTNAELVAEINAVQTDIALVQSDTNDIQARLPAALVGGRIDASVGAMAAGVQTAASHAVGSIDAAAIATDAVNEIRDAIGNMVIEGAVTLIESQRLHNSALGAKSSGHAAGSPVYRNLGDTKDVITATTDADGNRTTVTRDLT